MATEDPVRGRADVGRGYTRGEKAMLVILALGLAALLFFTIERDAQAHDPRVPAVPSFWFNQNQCPDYSQGIYGKVACAGEAFGMPGYNDGDPSVWEAKGMGPFVYWHEYAHLFDLFALRDEHRAKFLALTRDSRSWEGDESDAHGLDIGDMDAYDPPLERFADAFALCAMQATGRLMIGAFNWGVRGYPINVVGQGYGYAPAYRVHRRVCQLIWHAGGMRWSMLRLRLPERLWRFEVDSD